MGEIFFSAAGTKLLGTLLPKAKSSEKCVSVVTHPTPWRQLIEMFHIASTHDNVVWFQRGDQAGHNVNDMTSPLCLPSRFRPSCPT